MLLDGNILHFSLLNNFWHSFIVNLDFQRLCQRPWETLSVSLRLLLFILLPHNSCCLCFKQLFSSCSLKQTILHVLWFFPSPFVSSFLGSVHHLCYIKPLVSSFPCLAICPCLYFFFSQASACSPHDIQIPSGDVFPLQCQQNWWQIITVHFKGIYLF